MHTCIYLKYFSVNFVFVREHHCKDSKLQIEFSNPPALCASWGSCR